MGDKRQPAYAFTSERGLLDFFSQFLPPSIVRNIVADCKAQFRHRDATGRSEQRMQLLKKCEMRLMRMIKSGQ